MYAIVWNGGSKIVKTKSELDGLIRLYAYPKFQKVANELEALKWFRENERKEYPDEFIIYGTTAINSYVTLEFFFNNNNIYANLFYNHLGQFRISCSDFNNVSVSYRGDKMLIVVENVVYDKDNPAHYVIALYQLLNIIGDTVDVNVIVPDESIFLTLTGYKGTNKIVKKYLSLLDDRMFGLSYTVKQR